MANNRTGVAWSNDRYRTLTIRFRIRVVTCKASCIYANRDLFELNPHQTSTNKNPRQNPPKTFWQA